MRIWAISDLHLSISGAKPMDVFGAQWTAHEVRIAAEWDQTVAADDLVLMSGDLSWAKDTVDAAADLAWLQARPGRKVLIKGNHDYWWPKSRVKLQAALPPGTWAIKKYACIVDGIGVCGARGGDFFSLPQYGDTRSAEDIQSALVKEDRELEMSIQDLDRQEAELGQSLRLRVALFHYPPFDPNRRDRRFHQRMLQARISTCIYGHLHGTEAGKMTLDETVDGIRYRCASADLIAFRPLLIWEG
jgi:predicted phosphohydrolase